MTLNELRDALKQGKALTHISDGMCNYYIQRNGRDFVARGKETDEYVGPYSLRLTAEEILKDNIPYEIYEKPILDKAEKRYLSEVIRPFRKNYKITVKKVRAIGNDEECICIWFYDSKTDSPDGMVNLPQFKAGGMYKGMKANKVYALKELGL